ncbi:hypothetical protein FE784_07610 [Paenibacillus hemerocallicola]|uniref:Uncharacterized protein n=1 Tax=Paenibacillus hemerocallicola TaxID=1172614 RepID=A0A5C4TD99_9BACL|nr:hypothetical protein [Paenibacillus hemerocallicola]TNJ67054.1 hypothetical protein FE784_07610 [Paenibacillus hemerocallicola]
MIVLRPAVRTFGLVSVAFALLWSFLMPTAERVVTPISQSIPAVSAPASIHSPLGAPAHFLQKLRVLLPLVAIFLPLCSVLLCDIRIRTRLERFAPPVPLLRKQLFLRPLKFTSKFVSA